MHKIQDLPRQWKIGIVIVLILVLAGIGAALQRSRSATAGNVFGIQNAPSLTASVHYSSDISPDVKKTLDDFIADLRLQLQKNPASYDAWLTLAIRYKQAGDLEKARDVWLYIASIHPDDAVSRHNLGDLYHHFLKDYPKAEVYYKQALALTPKNSLEYLSLYELYRYSYKQDTTAAIDTLKLGIQQVEENQKIDLYIALANYYGDKGQKDDARANFIKARDLARKAGNTKLVVQLDAAIASIK